MGPLQESLAKALPTASSSTPPPPSLPPTNHQRKKSKKPATTMQWHDNISSYRCFETIATPSPIPIAKGIHRSTSLDSLANSEPNHSDNSSDSWCDTDEQSDTVSQCDSITDSKEPDNEPNESIYEPFFNDCTTTTKPIITQLVKKKAQLKLCENKQCAYRQFEQYHLIDDCAPNTNTTASVSSDTTTAYADDEDAQSKDQTSNVPFILNSKTRRTSVASSGSVSRMETIVEEPIEPKISVKEILARFETLTSLEVCTHPTDFKVFFCFKLIIFFSVFILTLINLSQLTDSNQNYFDLQAQ